MMQFVNCIRLQQKYIEIGEFCFLNHGILKYTKPTRLEEVFGLGYEEYSVIFGVDLRGAKNWSL